MRVHVAHAMHACMRDCFNDTGANKIYACGAGFPTDSARVCACVGVYVWRVGIWDGWAADKAEKRNTVRKHKPIVKDRGETQHATVHHAASIVQVDCETDA